MKMLWATRTDGLRHRPRGAVAAVGRQQRGEIAGTVRFPVRCGRSADLAAEPIGKGSRLRRHLEIDEDHETRPLLAAAEDRRFEAPCVEPHPHFRHCARQLAGSQTHLNLAHTPSARLPRLATIYRPTRPRSRGDLMSTLLSQPESNLISGNSIRSK